MKKFLLYFSLLLMMFLVSCIREVKVNYQDFISQDNSNKFVILQTRTVTCNFCATQNDAIIDYLNNNPDISKKTNYYYVSLDEINNSGFKNAPYYALQGGLIILYDGNKELGRMVGSYDIIEIATFLNKLYNPVPTLMNLSIDKERVQSKDVQELKNLEVLKQEAILYNKKTGSYIPITTELSNDTVINLQILNSKIAPQ